MFRIGEFSKLTQTPVKTLRYYDEIGLLSPIRSDNRNAYRYYTAEHFERLNRLLALKDLDFSLREIRDLLSENVPRDQLRELLCRKRKSLEARVNRERARLARAKARLDLLDGIGLTAAQDLAVRFSGRVLIASIRDTVKTHESCEELLQELDHQTSGVKDRGQRGAIWHSCSDGAVECEAFRFLKSPLQAKGRVRIRMLPAGTVVSLLYRGDREYMPAYRSIRAWLKLSKIRTNGPKREIYLENGGRDIESVTEIQFPIATIPEEVLEPGRA